MYGLCIAFGFCFLTLNALAEDFQCPNEYQYFIQSRTTISSPFYGEDNGYRTGLNCVYKITAPEGYNLKVTFEDFDLLLSLGCEVDRVIIFADGRFHLAHCGSEIPKAFVAKREIILRFVTSYEFAAGRRGFSINVVPTKNETICDQGYSLCENGNCYENSRKCNGIDDCGDGSEEEDCGYQPVYGECGKPIITPNTAFSTHDRMVGGEVAKPHSWPWQVSLRMRKMNYAHFCGGTLINSLWVLTATHCFEGISTPEEVEVHFGVHNKYEKGSFTRNAVRLIAYPNLEGEDILKYNLTQDVGLVKLNAPVGYTDAVQPACLPEQGWELDVGSKCFTTGWGETRGSGDNKFLKQTHQIVVSAKDCDYEDLAPKSQICVDNFKNTPCRGDSGGPFVCEHEKKWYVFGATSLGTRDNLESSLCATPGIKTIFAKISAKVDWIKETIEKNS